MGLWVLDPWYGETSFQLMHFVQLVHVSVDKSTFFSRQMDFFILWLENVLDFFAIKQKKLSYLIRQIYFFIFDFQPTFSFNWLLRLFPSRPRERLVAIFQIRNLFLFLIQNSFSELCLKYSFFLVLLHYWIFNGLKFT
jgi:hypothetical protein